MTQLFRWSVPLLVACATGAGTAAPDPTDAGTSAAGASEVVATIGGEPITEADLMEFAAAQIIAADVAAHEARTNAVNDLISKRLVEAEADRQGIAAEDLIKREVTDKLAEPTDAEVAGFYAENRDRMGGRGIDEVRPRIADFLMQQKGGELMQAYLAQLEAAATVERKLQPYRVQVQAGDSPRWGSADAPVQIVEFSDFQCPYCARGAQTIEEVKQKYGDKVSIVYRHFPLPIHAQATRAAEAAECANDQGKFWEFHDALFANTKPWSDDDFAAIGKDVGLKKKPFAECLESGKHADTVQTDIEEGRQVGMQGTPGFYVNGVVISGAQPIDAFTKVIDRELARR